MEGLFAQLDTDASGGVSEDEVLACPVKLLLEMAMLVDYDWPIDQEEYFFPSKDILKEAKQGLVGLTRDPLQLRAYVHAEEQREDTEEEEEDDQEDDTGHRTHEEL